MSKRLLSLLLAVLLVAVFCCVPAFADESSADTSGTLSTVSDETSSNVSAETSSSVSADTSSTASTAGDTTGNASAATGEENAAGSQTPWGLFIALFVIVCFVIVCLICIKVKNRFGIWLAKFLRDYKSEFGKISWLAPKELVKQTGVVLVILIIAAVVLGLLDWGFSSLIKLLALL